VSAYSVRPGNLSDLRPAYDVFRASLWDYVRRIGLVPHGRSDDVEATWERQRPTMEHLGIHAAEFWVAEDDSGLLGMARSLERDGVFQLTEFFVHPRHQSSGLGRTLLERAFPTGRGRHRSIMATQDPRALGLYLKFGVSFQSSMLDSELRPKGHHFGTDLEFVPAGDHDDPASVITALDRTWLDHGRRPEAEFFLEDRPGVLYRRDGEWVGYGFESNGTYAGPFLVSDPSDLPAVLSHLENDAAEREIGSVPIEFSLSARPAVDWVLGRGHRFFGFYIVLLASDPFIPWDRYLPYSPAIFF
jgi:GNAT superfamily N-acetyltransferase